MNNMFKIFISLSKIIGKITIEADNTKLELLVLLCFALVRQNNTCKYNTMYGIHNSYNLIYL